MNGIKGSIKERRLSSLFQKRKDNSNSQEIAAGAVFNISIPENEQDKAMKLDLLPPVLAGSLTFSEFVACISRGSFKMPGRTKVTKMIDELYEDMMLKLKDMLKQSSSVSLTTEQQRCQIVHLVNV